MPDIRKRGVMRKILLAERIERIDVIVNNWTIKSIKISNRTYSRRHGLLIYGLKFGLKR